MSVCLSVCICVCVSLCVCLCVGGHPVDKSKLSLLLQITSRDYCLAKKVLVIFICRMSTNVCAKFCCAPLRIKR